MACRQATGRQESGRRGAGDRQQDVRSQDGGWQETGNRTSGVRTEGGRRQATGAQESGRRGAGDRQQGLRSQDGGWQETGTGTQESGQRVAGDRQQGLRSQDGGWQGHRGAGAQGVAGRRYVTNPLAERRRAVCSPRRRRSRPRSATVPRPWRDTQRRRTRDAPGVTAVGPSRPLGPPRTDHPPVPGPRPPVPGLFCICALLAHYGTQCARAFRAQEPAFVSISSVF